VPDRLRDIGVTRNQIQTMAKMAPCDPTAGGNPVELTEDAAAKLLDELI